MLGIVLLKDGILITNEYKWAHHFIPCTTDVTDLLPGPRTIEWQNGFTAYEKFTAIDRTKENELRIQHGETHGDQTEVNLVSSHHAPPDARKKSKRTGYNHILEGQRSGRPSQPKDLTAKRDSYPGPVEPVETEEDSLTSLYPGLEIEIRRGTSRTERNRTKLWPQNCTSYLVYTHRKSQENRTITMDPSKLFS